LNSGFELKPSAGTINRRTARALQGLAAFIALVLCIGIGVSSAGAAPASVTMAAIEEVSYASVRLTGEVGPTEAEHETFYYFQYSTDGENWTNGPLAFEPGRSISGGTSSSTPVSEDLTGLKGRTKYIVRLAVFDSFEGAEAFSAERPSFKTLPVDPPASVSADNASELSYTTAKVSGEVERPSGNADPAFDVSCRFEYVSDQQFNESGFESPGTAECAENPIDTQGSPVNVTAELSGLSPDTVYHLRLSAENAGGKISDDAPSTFTTLKPDAPTVSIDPAGSITATSAHFSGEVTPGGTDPTFATSWEFVCQPSCPGEGSSGSIEPPDASAHPVSFEPAGLEPNTDYQVELIATNQGGSESAQTSFHTNPTEPVAETIPAFALGGGTEAVIGGKVNPRNSETSYWLEYGPGTGTDYPRRIPASPGASAGSGGQTLFETQKITGLVPASTYHFRIVAENASGTSDGEDLTFETLPTPTPPPASCPNDNLRGETGSEALGECRAYEMTSASDKNGGGVSNVAGADVGGNRLGYYSNAGFANSKSNTNNTYLASRGPTGWTTVALQPREEASGLASIGNNFNGDFVDEYSKAIFVARGAASSEPNAMNVLLTGSDGATTWITKPTLEGLQFKDKNYAGRSADGTHIVFQSNQPFSDEGNGADQVWEWVNGQVRLVSLLPQDQGGGPAPEAEAGAGANGATVYAGGFGGLLPELGVVSEDGNRIFFGIRLGSPSSSRGVFVREDGTKTRELDLSQRIGSIGEKPTCREVPGAIFIGAAADGSMALFACDSPLTDDAPPSGGLYAYDLETEDLSFLASDIGFDGSAGVALVSKDGSHVYFVSGDILVPGKGVPGGHNLYLSDPQGVHYIASLDDDDGQDWSLGFHGTDQKTVAATPAANTSSSSRIGD
jgi:hypothetical protein